LEHAGGSRRIFSDAAVAQLYELSQGVPRRIRQLAELSLLASAAEELDEVTAAVVDSVYRSLTADGIAEAA